MPLELMAAGRRGHVRAGRGDQRTRSGGGRSTPSTSAAACRSTSARTRTTPTYAEYAAAAAGASVPGLLRRAVRPGHRVRPLAARQARHDPGPRRVREAAGRPAHRRHPRGRPGRHPHRVRAGVLAAAGRRVRRRRAAPRTGRPSRQDIAGPCCFAGDLVAENRPLPLLEPGDHAAVLDTGAYYFAHHSRTTALPGPGFTASRAGGRAQRVAFATVREPQTLEEIVAESGGGHGGTRCATV